MTQTVDAPSAGIETPIDFLVRDLKHLKITDLLARKDTQDLADENIDLSASLMEEVNRIRPENIANYNIESLDPMQERQIEILLSGLSIALFDAQEFRVDQKKIQSPSALTTFLNTQKNASGKSYFQEFPNIQVGLDKITKIFETQNTSEHTFGKILQNSFPGFAQKNIQAANNKPLMSDKTWERVQAGGLVATGLTFPTLLPIMAGISGTKKAIEAGEVNTLGGSMIAIGKHTLQTSIDAVKKTFGVIGESVSGSSMNTSWLGGTKSEKVVGGVAVGATALLATWLAWKGHNKIKSAISAKTPKILKGSLQWPLIISGIFLGGSAYAAIDGPRPPPQIT